MIEYEFGTWGVGFIFSCNGSVFNKSAIWGVAAATVAMTCEYLTTSVMQGDELDSTFRIDSAFAGLWSGYTFILGFLLVFRTQIAFGRYWEGLTSIQSIKAVWFNAASNLVAFSNPHPERELEVREFQHLLMRLMSMMFCSALNQCKDHGEEDDFGIISDRGMNKESLNFLADHEQKCIIIMQWIQRHVVQAHNAGVVNIAPPILSRIFQELSNGIVALQSARKITEFKFPFPYAQIISVFLLIHLMVTPIAASLLLNGIGSVGLVTFCVVFSVWSLNYIAAEIENPFGNDKNDLDLICVADEFNTCLVLLMDPLCQHPPPFNYESHLHDQLDIVKAHTSVYRLIRVADKSTHVTTDSNYISEAVHFTIPHHLHGPKHYNAVVKSGLKALKKAQSVDLESAVPEPEVVLEVKPSRKSVRAPPVRLKSVKVKIPDPSTPRQDVRTVNFPGDGDKPLDADVAKPLDNDVAVAVESERETTPFNAVATTPTTAVKKKKPLPPRATSNDKVPKPKAVS